MFCKPLIGNTNENHKEFKRSFQGTCCSIKFQMFMLVFFATCLFVHCSDVALPTTELAYHECHSLDIRNDCSDFKRLENCTVIKGFLNIVLLSKDKASPSGECNWDEISFPLLREITDFIIFFHVKGLKSFRDMFPNLTVIRGRRLFLNYAIGISDMPDLEAVEFKSLIAIQRGHVFISSSPKLCEMEGINWDRLTLTGDENHILQVAPKKCKTKSVCYGCNSLYCWSNRVCQKFENDNVLLLGRDTYDCDEQCLGGCGKKPTDCAVCRGLTDHGKCVKKCPTDKLQHELSQRCYTYDECSKMGLLKHQNACVARCPAGFKKNENKVCIPCKKYEPCVFVCNPEPYSDNIVYINNLGDADGYSNCDIINGSLFITIRNKINENDLIEKLGNLREIWGQLQIFRSPYLTSLKFLSNLKIIRGSPIESRLYSLVIYDNKNLKELWKPNFYLKFDRGGIYIQSNNKLCNHNLLEFSNSILHDHRKDSIRQSDQEVLCGPSKLLLDIEVASHHELLFSWPIGFTYEKVEIMYRPVSNSEVFNDESELDTPVCERINWNRKLFLHGEINGNATHFLYPISGLSQNTKYACLVKTFGSDYARTARSDLVFITTKLDIPPPPKIQLLNKSNETITIKVGIALNYVVDEYFLQVYEKPDNVHYLDERNFCQNSAYSPKELLTESYSDSVYDEDYDDCCARLENSLEDERFIEKIESEFSCSLNRKQRCVVESTDSDAGSEQPLHYLHFLGNQSNLEIKFLKPFRLYVLMLKACNKVGCSSFSMHSERTNYTADADMVIGLDGCQMPNSTEYRIFFNDPKNPNGAIVSFLVLLRHYLPNAQHFQTHIGCVTRLEHENSNHNFVRYLNFTYNQVAIRAHSLAGDTMTDWLPITVCDATSIAGSSENKEISIDWETKRNLFVALHGIVAVALCIYLCYHCLGTQRVYPSSPDRARARSPESFVTTEDSPSDETSLVENIEMVRFVTLARDEEDVTSEF